MKIEIHAELIDDINSLNDYLEYTKISKNELEKAYELSFLDILKKEISPLFDTTLKVKITDD